MMTTDDMKKDKKAQLLLGETCYSLYSFCCSTDT